MLEGTPITLADGTKKPVETIQVGDRVLAYDESKQTTSPSEVVKVHAPYLARHYSVINGKIRVTETHPMLSRGTWVVAGELSVGDALARPDGSEMRIFSTQRIEAEAAVYNFQVALETYVAHDIVVHNKEDCLEYAQYCEGCDP